MDLSKLTEKAKVFQRRATQKVLQQMGMAEKTQEDGQVYSSFSALGTFCSQFKATVQATNSAYEKMLIAQSSMANQIQLYVSSELSGDSDIPGEVLLLQEITEKFYSACQETGNTALRTMFNNLEDSVLKPITKDEEFNNLTRDLTEEKKKATLDYDSFRRMAANAATPMEQEKIEIKLKQAKERFDLSTQKLADHIFIRNQIRCKLIIHSLVSSIQQYVQFYSATAELLKDTAASLKPLIDVYQMNENQLLNTVHLDPIQVKSKVKSPPPPQQNAKNADYLFAEQESLTNPQNNYPNSNNSNNSNNTNNTNNTNNHVPNRPKTTLTKSAANNPPPRVASPQLGRNDPQLDEMMHQSIAGMKKPAAVAPQPQRPSPTPMNQQIPPSKTPPPQQPPQNSTPPNLVDPFGDQWSSPTTASPSSTTPPSNTTDFLNLDDFNPSPSRPSAASPTNNLFGEDDLLFNTTPLQPNAAPFTPPLQPTAAPLQPNLNPLQPQRPGVSPTPPASSGAKPAPTTSGRTTPANYGGGNQGGYFNVPPQAQPPQSKPAFTSSNSQPNLFFPGASQPTPSQPYFPPQQNQRPPFSFDTPSQPPPVQSNSYVPPAQTKSQEVRQELNPAITEKIKNWAERGGRQSNLRALLSTLHEVIWVDSGWDGLSLADLVTGAQVKKAYRRANLIVHPDKVTNGTVEQQLMAQRIFEALRLSYEKFKDEPQ